MSSNYRTGTLYLYTLEPSENRKKPVKDWNRMLNKYNVEPEKFKLVESEVKLISDFFIIKKIKI